MHIFILLLSLILSFSPLLSEVRDNQNSMTADSLFIKIKGHFPDILSVEIVEDKIFAGTEEGIFISTDNGNEWVASLDIPVTHYLKYLDGKLYACSEIGLFQSTNNGQTWKCIFNEFSVDSVWVINEDLYFNSRYHGIYKSIGKSDFEMISLAREEISSFIDYYKPCIENGDKFTFSGKGSGTQEDPYQIETLQQLQELRYDLSGINYYIIMNDIDATETRYWNVYRNDEGDTICFDGFLPIDSDNIRVIDGRGHKISNLYMYNHNYGQHNLFNGTNCFILKRIGFENLKFEGHGRLGMFFVNTRDTNTFRVEECYFTGSISIDKEVESKTLYSTGNFWNNSIMKNCYADFTISTDSTISNFGRIANKDTLAQFKNCYALGNNSASRVLSPFGYNGNVVSCFWDADKIKVTNDSLGLGLGLSTADMMKRSTFESAGWDFENVWYIEEGMDYPKLKCFRDGVGVEDKEPVNSGIAEMSITGNADKIKIDYSLPTPGQVKIKIFNSLGALEGVIFEGFSQFSDSGSTQFDASALPSGMYFITLESSGIRLCTQYALIK